MMKLQQSRNIWEAFRYYNILDGIGSVNSQKIPDIKEVSCDRQNLLYPIPVVKGLIDGKLHRSETTDCQGLRIDAEEL